MEALGAAICGSRIPSAGMKGSTQRYRGRFATAWALCASCLALAACGSQSSQVDLTATRGCLADSGYRRVQVLDVAGSLPGSVAANLAMEKAGLTIEAIVNGNVARAQRRLADLRGALQSFGAPDPEGRVVRVDNAVVVFTPVPTAGARRDVLTCFEQG